MENTDNKEFGRLFNTIPIISEEHLDIILQTMSPKDSIYILVQAVKHAYNNNVYSIGESEVISKSIRVISKIETDTTQHQELQQNQ
jgi:hypothetical protein